MAEINASPSPAQNNAEELKEKISQDELTLSGMAYLPLLSVLTLILKNNSKFCRFHGNQGTMVTLLLFVIMVFLIFESAILGVTIIGSLAFLGWFGLMIVSSYRAFRGDVWEIPFLSEIAKKINLSSLIDRFVIGIKKEDTPKENPPTPPTAQA